MSYESNKPNITYYVNLNTYTKGKFGNTDFAPPLTDPIKKEKISYIMNDYSSLTLPFSKCSHNTKNFDTYAYFMDAYQKPNCQICSKSNC